MFSLELTLNHQIVSAGFPLVIPPFSNLIEYDLHFVKSMISNINRFLPHSPMPPRNICTSLYHAAVGKQVLPSTPCLARYLQMNPKVIALLSPLAQSV